MKFYRLASSFPTKSGSLLPTKRGRELPTLTKTNGFHEGLVILLPYRASFQVTMENDAFHVVGKNEPGDPHVLEGMDHTDE